MIPELFRIGDFAISPCGPLMVAAFLASYYQLRRGLERLNAGDQDDAYSLVVTAGAAGILGAKLYYALLYRDWGSLIDRSGLVWYGGFILATAVLFWIVRRRRMPWWPTLAAMAPALALGYAVGRVGCFLVGDDYGRPTEVPWGVAFPQGLPPTYAGTLRRVYDFDLPASVPDSQLLHVHPTQLYETAAALIIWGIGLWLLRRGAHPAVVFTSVVGLLALERFLVEILRVKDDRFFGPLTLAQVISLVVMAVCLGAGLWASRRPAASPGAA